MFKLNKANNVIAKLNKMSKKQIYTWAAIILVCFVALVTMAGFLGNASDDASFDGMNSRGYDLAQMPFLTDEAEDYLLASKYPDMKNNGSTALYTGEQKEARQEEDAQKAAEEEENSGSSVSDEGSGGYSGRVGGGYTGRGGSRTPTAIGQLNTSSSGSGRGGGGGMNASWGAPRGDFSPYKSQEKGSEGPVQPLQNSDARRALSQFAQTSRAAAGLKDGKGANAKRALMGGNIRGSEAFTENGVDLSKSNGLQLDTNAPTSSADLSNLDKDMADANKEAQKEYQEQFEKSFWAMLGEKLLDIGLDLGKQYLSGMLNDVSAKNKASRQARGVTDSKYGISKGEYKNIVGKDGVINQDALSSFSTKYGWTPSSGSLEGGYGKFKAEGRSGASYGSDYSSTRNTYEGQTFNDINRGSGSDIYQDGNGKYRMVNGVKHYLAK